MNDPWQMICTKQISELAIRLNDNLIASITTEIRMWYAQKSQMFTMPIFELSAWNSHVMKSQEKNNLTLHVLLLAMYI